MTRKEGTRREKKNEIEGNKKSQRKRERERKELWRRRVGMILIVE